MRRALTLLALLAFGAPAAPTAAQGAASGCSFTVATGLTFGAYDTFAPSGSTSAGTLAIVCGAQRAVTVSMDPGRNAAAFGSRYLSSGRDRLAYNIYLDPARTRVWGDGTGGTGTFAGATLASNSALTIQLYGLIPPGQNVTPGQYADSVGVTVDF